MTRAAASRRVAVLTFLGVLAATLAWTLASQSAPASIRLPLVARHDRGPLAAIPMHEREGGGPMTLPVRLCRGTIAELSRHDELWLFLSSPPSTASAKGVTRIASARLAVPGTRCHFDAAEGVSLSEDDPLVLRHSPECAALGTPGALSLDLTLRPEGPGGTGLWAYRPRDTDSERGPLCVAPTATDTGPWSVRAILVDHPPTAPRIDLLAAMWRLSESPLWLWCAVASAIGVLLAGVLLFPGTRVAHTPAPPGVRFVVTASLGAALIALGLTSLYAVLTPPLFGPDEPYHLLGFADLTGNRGLAADTVTWMGQTHLLRIRYRPDERFRTVDVHTPFIADDDQLRPTEVAMRSATLARLWSLIGPALRGDDAPAALLTLRILNACLFTLAVGLATALAVCCATGSAPQWLIFPAFFVPTLPFFAMHVSETALLCSIYVLFATSIVVLVLDGRRAAWVGLPLGLSCALMLAGGRSPWPLAPIVAAVLAARVLFGPGHGVHASRAAAIFWLGFGLGLGAFPFLLNPAYVEMMTVFAGFVPAIVRPPAASVGAFAIGGVALVVPAALVELGLARARTRAASRLAPKVRRPLSWAALAGVSWIVLTLLGSLLLQLPNLPREPRHVMTAGERVTTVLATMATLFRLRDPSFLLSTTFWVGFGWLDAIPGPTFQVVLLALAAVPTIGLLLALARPPQLRRLAWLLALAVGGALSLVLYTLVTQHLPMALQGRYLIGWYLVFLTVAACWLVGETARAAGTNGPAASVAERWALVRAGALLGVAGVVHAYCLRFVLERYF